MLLVSIEVKRECHGTNQNGDTNDKLYDLPTPLIDLANSHVLPDDVVGKYSSFDIKPPALEFGLTDQACSLRVETAAAICHNSIHGRILIGGLDKSDIVHRFKGHKGVDNI